MAGPPSLGAAGLGGEQPEHAVGVAHRRDLGVGHDDRLVGEVHRHLGALLDAGGRVADDVLEAHLLELFDDPADPLGIEGVLVARLRRRQDVEIFDPLVADQRLLQLGLVADDVDEVVDDAPLAPHHQVEVAQPDVEVDRDGLLPLQGDAGRDVGAGGGLTDPTFTGSDDDDFGRIRHVSLLHAAT